MTTIFPPPSPAPEGPAYYILKDHQVVECTGAEEWAAWFENADRRVEYTKISSTVNISTVFLGTDHQMGDGPPLIFESMVFRDGDGQDMGRYSTWDQAVAGHRRFVAAEMLKLGEG